MAEQTLFESGGNRFHARALSSQIWNGLFDSVACLL